MAPALELHYAPGACSLAVHIVLQELDLDFTATSIGFPMRFPANFAAVNPKLRVPVLIYDGAPVTEVPAILTALAQLAPQRELLGRPGLEVVRAYEWMNYLSGELHGRGFGCLWRPGRYSDDETVHKGIRAKGRQTVEECFVFIEERLRGEHAVGEAFTAVDAYLYVFWRWGVDIGLDAERFVKYKALAAGVEGRPAARKALEAEGIPLRADHSVKSKV